MKYYNYLCHLYAIGDYFVEVKLTAITREVESIQIAQAHNMKKFINQIELPVFS